MKKAYTIPLVLISIFVGFFIYVFFVSSACSEYGGFVGVKHNCKCVGVEVKNVFVANDFSRSIYKTACVGFAQSYISLGAKNPNCYKKVQPGNCKACLSVYEYNEASNVCIKKCHGGCGDGYITFRDLKSCEEECVR